MRVRIEVKQKHMIQYGICSYPAWFNSVPYFECFNAHKKLMMSGEYLCSLSGGVGPQGSTR